MLEKFTRWPLLVAAAFLTTTAVGMDLTTGPGTGIALACLMLAAACLGAFVYAEGARHREWWASHWKKAGENDQESPGPLPDIEE